MVAPGSARLSGSAGPALFHDRLAWWAVRLAGAGGAAIAAAVATVAVAYAVGAESAVEDNWVAVLTVVVLGAGLLAAFLGFVLAVAAKVKHVRGAVLWLPLAVFPAAVLFLALGEAFWWQ